MAGTTTIADRYRLEGRLGIGGMSTVHLAFDSRLERYVAVKLLAEHLADDPAFVSRFRREALAAARLVHPNIVQVFDFGFDESHHQHFIVMERVEGKSCAELLRDRGHLNVVEAVEITAQACKGLDYAHRGGVVHRDVKPGNLLVSESQVIKLADFGIARATDQSSITQVGSVLGTAAYLAPEQARGEEAGPRADLYSLGVVAYQLLSGRLPYEASSLSELALKQQREAPVPLVDINPRVPPELAQAISWALSIDALARPADALTLGDALRNGADGISPFGPLAETSALGTAATTRVLADSGYATEATRVAPVAAPPTGPRTGSTRRVPPGPRTTPRQVPARVPPREDRYESERPQRGGAGRAMQRVLVFLALAVVFIAAVAISVTLATSTSTSIVSLRNTATEDFNSAVGDIQSFIGKYTK
jgi:serine/threonine-protein kinase